MDNIVPNGEFPKWDYQEYPKTCARDDFWGQTRRTILGRRISDEEVEELVDHINMGLLLTSSDMLLELGCGNGALSARLFNSCAGFVGADLSAYLIEIAQEYFERAPDYRFVTADAVEFAASVSQPSRFTKILCYALVQYFPFEKVQTLLLILRERFPNLERLMIGNLPDREMANLFYRGGTDGVVLDEPKSQIGRWWTQDEFESLATRLGWAVGFVRMGAEWFNAEYRFDVILTPA